MRKRPKITLLIVLLASLSAQARPTDDGWSPSKIMKSLKRLVVKMLGDGVMIPRP